MKVMDWRSLVCCIVVGNLGAQRVWTVEEGQQIQPVVDAAAPGDRIVIRGNHQQERSLQVSKSLELVGDGDMAWVWSFSVSDLPRQGQVTFRNLVFVNGAEVVDCEGTVSYLDSDIGIRGLVGFLQTGGLTARDARHVHVERCRVHRLYSPYTGRIASIELQRSQLTLTDSLVQTTPDFGRSYSASTIQLRDTSRIVVDGSEIHGPTGAPGGFSSSCSCVLEPTEGGPAISGDGGVFVTGRSVLYGGRHAVSRNRDRPSPITVVGARISEDCVLVGRPFSALRVIPEQPGVALNDEARPGQSVGAAITGRDGDLVTVLFDLRAHGARFLPDTDLPIWLTRNAWPGGFGILTDGGRLEIELAIPDVPALRFSGLWMQAISLGAARPVVGVSGLRAVTVH